MSMSKKDFIALADVIRGIDGDFALKIAFDMEQASAARTLEKIYIERLADFCASQNPRFNRERWLAYIAGECGPGGGPITRERRALRAFQGGAK